MAPQVLVQMQRWRAAQPVVQRVAQPAAVALGLRLRP